MPASIDAMFWHFRARANRFQISPSARGASVNLAEKLVMRPIGALVPYASNSRTHTPEQKISKIARKRDGLGFCD
jgi:hypothetical protein